MGKKLRTFLAAFVAALGLVVLVFASHPSDAKAADYTSSDMVTNAEITDQNKTYNYTNSVGLTYELSHESIKNGDTLTIDLPEELYVKEGGTFEFKDDQGHVIGNGKLTESGQIQIEFIKDIDNFNGTLTIDKGIGINSDKTEIGNNTVAFPTVNGDQNSTLKIKENSENDISKKGTLGKDENGDSIITWSILVNRNELDLKNLVVSDLNISSGLDFFDDSLTIRKASWVDKNTGSYSKGSDVTNKYTVNYDENGMPSTIDFGDTGTQMFVISFQTKLEDSSQAEDGTVFHNEANMTGSYSTTGNNPKEFESSTSADVSGKTNSGNGSGTKYGSVVLTKTSADENNVLIPGATYSLYQRDADKDTLIQSDLVTDANGQITVDKLPAGDYYFVETSTPDGYQQNPNEIPFTITGQTTTAVQVETKDEPVGSKEGSIIIQKLDAATGYRLAGAEFDVIDADTNEVIGHITTDQLGYGHMYNIPYGNYILRETKAPDGYILNNEDIIFAINDETQAPAIISIDNEKETGGDGNFSASMIKYDADLLHQEKVGVAGAEYTLYDTDGTALGVFQTNDEGVIKVDNLNPGSYYFLETKAPDGYDINPEKIEFTITDSDIELGTLETSDPKLTGGSGGGETPGTDGNGNEGKDPDPDENGNTENPDPDGNGNEGNGDGDNNGGVIVDPENPGSNNNNNGNEGGLITNPINPGDANNGSDSSSNLPQTGEKTSLTATFLGLVLLSGIVYFKRRNA
ncbi:MAG TPA: Ig-like domain-containing protein [Companilactobacillus farciminis]|uniref:Ig-like domain-containing protein n=1 Tax=Companilactobacillus farciminis TaxID=1612 RepID=A0A921L8L9_9LACO|nr:Ig-like domain-containing protein [Companilactobacillus farciminis]